MISTATSRRPHSENPNYCSKIARGGAGVSSRAVEIARAFGVVPSAPRNHPQDLRAHLATGRIVALVGPSGSGKSTALRQLVVWMPSAIDVGRMEFAPGVALVDAIAPHATLADALGMLNACGLGEVRLWLRAYEELSEGEKFRARLARALSLAAVRGSTAVVVIDEFATGLHRRAAKSIACNIRKLAARGGPAIVIATPHEDVLADLQPDVLVTLSDTGTSEFTRRAPHHRPPTAWRHLRIVRGTRADYAAFADMHYRGGEELGFVDKVFCLRETASGKALGVVVYCHPPAELQLRNRATRGRYRGKLTLLNRDVRILRRLVVHPDLRGTGIAHRFVKRTLRMVGTPYVECLAAMGAFNPVFERAGMHRIGACNRPALQQRLLARLSELDCDPFASDFPVQIARRPQVREVAVRLVREWYEATSGTGADRAERQTPVQLARLVRGLAGSRPIYYLWKSRTSRPARILRFRKPEESTSPSTQGSPAGNIDRASPPGCPHPPEPENSTARSGMPCHRLRVVR